MSLLILKLHIYHQRLPRCGWATQPQPSQWRRGSSPWRRWRSSPRLVSPRWTITTLRRSVRWYETTIPSSFCNYKKNMFLKQIRSLLLDYYWSWMSSDSSWKILFFIIIFEIDLRNDWRFLVLSEIFIFHDFREQTLTTGHLVQNTEHTREKKFPFLQIDRYWQYIERKSLIYVEDWEQIFNMLCSSRASA